MDDETLLTDKWTRWGDVSLFFFLKNGTLFSSDVKRLPEYKDISTSISLSILRHGVKFSIVWYVRKIHGRPYAYANLQYQTRSQY